MMRVIVTGGAGFIGSAVCHYFVKNLGWNVLNFDNLSYSGNLSSVRMLDHYDNYRFVKGDICKPDDIQSAISNFQPTAILHLAAESHVDRSISAPQAFIETNILGTYHLLEAARHYWSMLDTDSKALFRFHHVSTDEVFGDLPFDDSMFSETSNYNPSSPYSASKAGSDHLVRAWGHTYGLPVLLTNCSNNYGPRQYPEKLLPLVILNALSEKSLPVYGTGNNVRDWLWVEDHAEALAVVLQKGRVGRSYNIGGNEEHTNIDVVTEICRIMDDLKPRNNGKPHSDLISFVTDRKGHDRRYAIDPTLIKEELGWMPKTNFATGLRSNIEWYLNNKDWWSDLIDNQ